MWTPRGTPFERNPDGTLFRDNVVATYKISHFLRLKTLLAAAFFGYLFFAVEKK